MRPVPTFIAAVTAAALTAATLGASTGASAAPAEDPSTPVPIATPEGQLSSYVLNAVRQKPNQTRSVERAVRKAGGTVVQSWPEIGVVVAHATSEDFRSEVLDLGPIASVGPTRTTAVKEGTPGTTSSRLSARRTTQGTAKGEFANTAEADVVTDPREAEQWDMKVIKADRAHEVTDGSRDVLVGVLDSGIDPDHPDLVANIDTESSVNCSDAGQVDTSATGWWPTTSDHGTHVAGTIAAARNGVGIVGVAPNARMASVKVVNDDGYIYPEYAICGFMWAGQHDMDVTNNSYYIDPFMYWCGDQPEQAPAMEAVNRAVQWSTKQGTVHAAAAGNAATDLANNTTDTSSPNDSAAVNRTINSSCLDIPAELPGVVTVSSFARKDTTSLDTYLSYFSNRGLDVIDVGAPGSSILSTIVNGNGYGLKSGTSMASPHAAGVLALLAGTHPDWTPAQLAAGLEAQADDKACEAPQRGTGAACVGTVEDNSYAGEGMIDALDAVTP
ncbi:S8 family serine peptidase [Nocardioides aestuarii]|uniref:S8 family serine peptidase n=1 Tax=Nocardioides aestuarii TaxID=252231 RepID=A0ABW4TR07_9ACTN